MKTIDTNVESTPKGIESAVADSVKSVVAAIAATKSVILGKFPGAFGGFQETSFNDLRYAGVNEHVAHKIAFDYGSDLGNAIRNAKDAALASKVGKAKSNGEARISLSGGGITKTSRAMSVIRLAQQLDMLYTEKLIKSREIDLSNLRDGEGSLGEYLTECDEWAKLQKWADS
jgi:dsRNA-specific ribonuclease